MKIYKTKCLGHKFAFQAEGEPIILADGYEMKEHYVEQEPLAKTRPKIRAYFWRKYYPAHELGYNRHAQIAVAAELGIPHRDLVAADKKKYARAKVRLAPAQTTHRPAYYIMRRQLAANGVGESDLPQCIESMGGITELIAGGLTIAQLNTRTRYARSCRYPANHGYLAIHIAPHDVQNLRSVAGLLTISKASPAAMKSGRRAWRAKWLEVRQPKRNCKKLEAQWTRGWICGDYHSAVSAADAMAGYRRRLEAEAQHRADVFQREQMARREARTRIEQLLDLAAGRKIIVRLADSYAAGNCPSGTAQFGLDYHIFDGCSLRSLLAASLLAARHNDSRFKLALLCAAEAIRRYNHEA